MKATIYTRIYTRICTLPSHTACSTTTTAIHMHISTHSICTPPSLSTATGKSEAARRDPAPRRHRRRSHRGLHLPLHLPHLHLPLHLHVPLLHHATTKTSAMTKTKVRTTATPQQNHATARKSSSRVLSGPRRDARWDSISETALKTALEEGEGKGKAKAKAKAKRKGQRGGSRGMRL